MIYGLLFYWKRTLKMKNISVVFDILPKQNKRFDKQKEPEKNMAKFK